jgi:hypothetical protein
MSNKTGKSLNTDHKCLARKCKGTKVDPPESYGTWAYWWAATKNGWHSQPYKGD